MEVLPGVSQFKIIQIDYVNIEILMRLMMNTRRMNQKEE
jgi:hypothetical protein